MQTAHQTAGFKFQSPNFAAQRTWEANFQANGYKLAAPKSSQPKKHGMTTLASKNAGCCLVKGLNMSELFRFMSLIGVVDITVLDDL